MIELRDRNAVVTVLLAEDDPGHARLVERNLRRAGVTNHIVHASNGRTALDFVFREGEQAGSTHEKLLILLDLNMPVMDGYEVLELLKRKDTTQRIPVIVLTTTDVREDIERCYSLGCNIFLTKPIDFDAFAEAVHRVGLLISVMAVPDTVA